MYLDIIKKGGASVINVPVITAPLDGAIDFNGTLTTGTFTTGSKFAGIQDKAEWEFSQLADFSTLDATSGIDLTNLTSIASLVSAPLTKYYTRVRVYSDNHISDWSKPISFTSPDIYIQTPVVTVDGAPDVVDETPFFYGAAFTVVNGTDTHASSDWTVKDSAGTVVWSSIGDTVNLESIQVPKAILLVSSVYTFDVKYNGTTYGGITGTVDVTTKAVFFIDGVEAAILIASDGLASDNFGWSVSLSADGSVIVVGANGADTANVDQGKAYIYSWDGTTATEMATLISSDGIASDNFGRAVEISADGTVIVVGAYLADTANADQGKAYIFSWDGTTATEQAILTASDGAASDSFGFSVYVNSDGSVIVVGASSADTANVDQGKVYIYSWDGTTATEKAILTASDGLAYDNFGSDVTTDTVGTVIVVGAKYADTANSNQGKAYIFSWDGTTATELAILTASDGIVDDYFGYTVSTNTDGTIIVVGSQAADTANANQGKVYIYSWDGTTATEKAILTASDGAASDYFGTSVSISDDGTALGIGSSGSRAYLFKWDGVTATEKAILTASDSTASDYYGVDLSVNADGTTVVVGARLADTANLDQGKAYILV